jgi:hypothetical protein
MEVTMLRASRFATLFCLLLMSASEAQAQAITLAGDVSTWRYDTGSSRYDEFARTGLGFGIAQNKEHGVSPQLQAEYVPQGTYVPGIFALTLGARTRLIGQASEAGMFLALGGGLIHVSAQNQERELAACTIAVGCMAEGVIAHHTGTYPYGEFSLGLVLPIVGPISVLPNGSIGLLSGKHRYADHKESFARFFAKAGVGIAFRL